MSGYFTDGSGRVIQGPMVPEAREFWRPVVVIDPEDREQAERLLSAYHGQYVAMVEPSDVNVERFQAALRSLIAPPKPEEPTEFASIAIEEDGTVWHRVRDGEGDGFPWATRDSKAKWSNLRIVKVAPPFSVKDDA